MRWSPLLLYFVVLLADKKKALSAFNRLIVLGYEVNYHVVRHPNILSYASV
jgi:hypothetical protein